MKAVKITGIVILLISSCLTLSSQQIDYMDRMETIYDVQHSHNNYVKYISDASNPLEFIFATLFVGYKYFLSSQDMGSCVFHPSCSVYGIESVREKGIIIGAISTFDRLTRCHNLASSNYIYDPVKKKLYDPVD